MSSFVVNIAKTKKDLDKCYPVIKELRPHLTESQFHYIYKEANRSDSYEIVYQEIDSQVVAVMGYRLLYDYVRGKHLYIDDLVVTEKFRSKKLGAELLQYAEQIAKKLDCASLRLCTGVENEKAVRFYEKNSWIKRAYAYTKKIL